MSKGLPVTLKHFYHHILKNSRLKLT